ncbi:protein NUCLEAR FUSION DEFECTIVE 6, mitochondrial isoform X2 [Helianthus annuus]|uniref:protein NUCLEAR FUSION DEFECTIVE 6, mitochondrial isoform X2 n=1 Tax=Helianthus annuus TaxID=4232 RepID=UPI000B906289|nr:protein NUCLEAR FUSION DEFECTIVE 6, mitochondrial isoform X2 [Helianthus annuus]
MAAAARSFFRSTSVRNAAARISSEAKCKSPSPFQFSTTKPLSHRAVFRRCPVKMSSVCLETMQPFHTATASSLMTSMLTASSMGGYAWLPQACNNDL